MRDDITQLREEAERDLRAARTPEALEELRLRYLGRRGKISAMFEELASMPPGERAAVGAALNEAQAFIKGQFETVKTQIALAGREAQLEAERIDVTLPGLRRALGRRHILNQSIQRVQDIFIRMGFELVEGTEIETDQYNFERLNIPRDHPARDDQDTFYITEELLLRTQTTAVDAHVLRERRPPMRILTAGRCYRRDVVDATHMPVFHQVDGFMVGEGITFADLKGTLAAFAREMFGPQTRTRFQPGYFPFTEPSAEVAVEYGDGWLELAGCGMFHPRVLEFAGIDPERCTAFAFGGFGDRPAMVRYGIPDIRLFWENDLRMLAQF
ncbi:MAG TPA: phenylalanine--tRNA ligase subunit alpha [bacterium]|jgi:phenylalanyl-tRNA synthetase alpha chain|nr:phenylalanine--tRNA ligase subunit alpha [bacterium]